MPVTVQPPLAKRDDHARRPAWRYVIRTKLRAPAHAGAQVQREKLIERLELLRTVRLVVLRAPAGYGKTTLAAQWRRALLAAGTRVAWLNLDAGDNEPSRFCAYLIEALSSAGVLSSERLLTVLEGRAEQVGEYVLADLINLVSAHEGDVWMVCEDWHLIQDQRVHDILAFLLAHSPANLHFLITSRKRLPLALSRLRVGGQMKEFGARDLRFDATESQRFVRDVNALQLPVEIIDSLWRTTDGWIAGLQLASLSMRSSENPEQVLAELAGVGAQRPIGEYLTENVVDSLPAKTLFFLLQTSILERLSAPLCTAVTGCVDSQKILETLERQDLFILPLDSERRWFRYHQLFRSYLRRRLDRDHPGLAVTLERAACEWFAAQGHTDEAVAHALAAGAEDRAIELVERDAMLLVEHSHMATLLGLIHRLPTHRLVDRPRLQIAIAWAHCLTHHPDGVHRALACVEDSLARSLDDPDDREEIRAEAQLVRGATEAYADRIELIEEFAQPCIDRAEQWRPWLAVVAANILSYRFIHTAQFERARHLQAWARKFYHRIAGPFSGVYGLCLAGMAASGQGELDAAIAHLQEALEWARAGAGRHSHAARLATALWGQIQYEHNELEAAEHLLEESRALGAEGGVVDFSLATYVTLTRLRALAGDLADAHELLDEGLETAHRLHFERLAAALDAERIRLYLQVGAIQRAEQVIGPRDDGFPGAAGTQALICEYRTLARARIELAQGNATAAVARLRNLIVHAHADGRRLVETTLRLILARALEAHGDRARARTELVAAVEAGARQGLVRSFLDEGLLPMLTQLRDAVRNSSLTTGLSDVAIRHLDRLIAAADISASWCPAAAPESRVSAVGARHLVEPLTDREIQIMRLLERGYSNKEIARELDIAVNTVKWHLKSLYSKLCVSRRTQAVAEVKRLGLID